jgi:superfamily II DNA or RNA helicase
VSRPTLTIDKWAYVPTSSFKAGWVDNACKELTFVPEPIDLGGGMRNIGEPIPNFSRSREGCVGFPIDWAMRRIAPHADVVDHTSRGEDMHVVERLPDPNHPQASAGQGKFIEGLEKTLRDKYAVLAEAPTGSGKTVSALCVAAKLGRKTLVIVPTVALMHQWVVEIQDKLGANPERIGLIYGGITKWEDCDFCVAVINSVAANEYGDRFHDSFGMVIWDEAHITGAYTFRKSLSKFRARYRLALTATPHRKDGACQVYKQFFGAPSVVAKVPALKAEVKVHLYDSPRAYGAEDSQGRMLSMVSKDPSRNRLMVGIIKEMLIDDRMILAISDRTEQLKKVAELLIRGGVREEAIGFFVGSLKNLVTGKKYKDRGEYLDTAKNSRVILATYGMMKQGIDIPELDGGIDLTPKTQGVQVIGRIRRLLPNKGTPVWHTIEDVGGGKLRSITKARLRDYKTANVEVHYA